MSEFSSDSILWRTIYVMSESLSGQATVSVSVNHSSTSGLVTYRGNLTQSNIQAYSTSQVTYFYQATLTATATPTSLDLHTGLTDTFGLAIAMTTLKYLYIVNNDATHSLTLFGGTNPVIPNTLVLTAGGCISLADAFTVGSSTANIKIDPGANTVSFNVILLGS